MIPLRCVTAALGATILSCNVAVAQSAAESELIEGLVRYLGVEADQREAVLGGQTVVAGLPGIEARDEEIAAGGAFLLVDGVSALALVEAFLATGSFEQFHEVARDDSVALSGEWQSDPDHFSEFTLDLSDEPHAIIRAPAEYFNLAPEELDYIASIDPGAADVDRLLTAAMRRVLNERLSAYVMQGLGADRVYLRAGGDDVSPTEQLRSALSRMAVIKGPFEPFVEAVLTPVAEGGGNLGVSRQLHWVEKLADDRRVVALADQILYFDQESALAAEMHYYVSGTYDALLTVVGATPVEGQTLLFAISHTFTGRVVGVGAGLRHRVARRIVSEGLAAHLERVRERVAADL